MNKLYSFFLSESAKIRIERFILYVAFMGFFAHLALIYLNKWGWISLFADSELLENPISAVYTPFSFILVYEVYLLIYYLPKSFTTYITKQYQIITLIIIRKLFKDLSALELSTDWFEIKGDLQFTYDLLASLILFYLIYQFQKQGKRIPSRSRVPKEKTDRFIARKKLIATFLVPLFCLLAVVTLGNWLGAVSFDSASMPALSSINSLFFDEFFTMLILVDVVLLLISLFYTDEFHKIIRNSGFVVSTILIRMSFGVSGLISTVLIVVAVLFGLMIILTHNKYEKDKDVKTPGLGFGSITNSE